MTDLVGKTVFWRNDQVDIINRLTGTEDFKQSSMLKYLYCPCAWISPDRGTHFGWYDQSENYHIGWMPYDINKFEPEFRLALLLMGVT